MKLFYYALRLAYRRRALSYREPPDQAGLLLDMIRANETSRYGRRYDFHLIQSIEDYRKRVPIVTYDDLEEWVERIRRGEDGVLTTEAIRWLEPTGGSSGRHKWIPYTKGLKQQFQRTIEAWLYDIYTSYPGLMGGKSYWMITPPLEHDETASAIPVGFDDDSAYLGGLGSRLVSHFMVRPDLKPDMTTKEFYTETLRALLEEPDLRLISVWNPTLLVALLDHLELDPEAVLQKVSIKRRQAIRKVIYHKDYGAVWPKLALISAWSDSTAKPQAEELMKRFPEVSFQPKGLLSTEAVVSFPTRESLSAGGMLPAYRSTFLEFRQGQDTHLLSELEMGEEYEVIITTGGGLYRYATGDLIQVTGRLRGVPLFRFVGRERTIDLTGEKMSEGFVRRILGERPGFYLLTPSGDGYTLYTDSWIDPTSLEESLKGNFHYRLARRLGQLRPVKVFFIKGDARQQYLENCLRHGQKLGDIKPTLLSARDDFQFKGDYHD